MFLSKKIDYVRATYRSAVAVQSSTDGWGVKSFYSSSGWLVHHHPSVESAWDAAFWWMVAFNHPTLYRLWYKVTHLF